MDHVAGKFQGFLIYQNENGFWWARGGYYDDVLDCQDSIEAFNLDHAADRDDSPSLDDPWWSQR